MQQATLTMRDGTWDEALVREAAEENRYGLATRYPRETLILDVGAHIGGFAIAAAGRGARVWCFEPDPENFRLLMENTAAYRRSGRIRAEWRAVWRSDRLCASLPFNPLRRLEGGWGVQTGAGTCCVEVQRPGTVEVPAVPLDRLLREAGSVELLKLDCEFAEYPILLTSRHLRRVRRVAAEFHEVPGPLVPEARVGSIDVFRGEHLAGALLHEGFEVTLNRTSPWHGYLYAARPPDRARRKRVGGRVNRASRSVRPSPTARPSY
jgi:FkbM family methyltransferase